MVRVNSISGAPALASATSTAQPHNATPTRRRSPVSFRCVSVQMTEQIAGELAKPKWRGVLHQAAFVVAVGLAPLLIVTADGGRAQFAAAVFASSVVACFGASALYHRVTWKPRARLWMRRIDHAGVYLLIAGTYTPVSLLVLRGAWRPVVLTIIWAGAAAAIVLKFVWVGAPKWLAAAIGIALGWVAVIVLPQMIGRVDLAAVILLVAGGLAYTLGAVVYVRRRPDPAPAVFGYHELFHALTIVGVACQYVAIAFFIVRAG
jgi:hemolysin III